MITWPFIKGCVPNFVLWLTIYLRMCSKLPDLLDHLSMNVFQTTWFYDLLSMDMFQTNRCAWTLYMDVFQTTLFTWTFVYGCVSNYLLYLTIYLWMGLKLHDDIYHYLWMFSKGTWFTCALSMVAFTNYIMCSTIFYECVPNYMIHLTIYLWMCSKLHDLLDHLSMDVFKTTWCALPSSLDVFQIHTCFT